MDSPTLAARPIHGIPRQVRHDHRPDEAVRIARAAVPPDRRAKQPHGVQIVLRPGGPRDLSGCWTEGLLAPGIRFGELVGRHLRRKSGPWRPNPASFRVARKPPISSDARIRRAGGVRAAELRFGAGDRKRSFAGADHPRLSHQVVEAFFIICPDISIFETVMVSPSWAPVSFTVWPACSSSPATSWFAILSTFPL